jgi:3-oxoadipate enol-lactonase
MGGMIGQTAALKYPGIFKTLTLADTTSRYAPEAKALWEGRMKTAQEQGMGALVAGTLERWFTEPYRKANPQTMERVGGYIRSTPVPGYVGCIQGISQIDATDRLKEIKVPTLVICGEEDMGTPPAMSRAIRDAMPQAQLSLLANAAHLSNVERPIAFNKALGDFLAKNA